jgi:ABC-type amino acid transport substrate-binding protein
VANAGNFSSSSLSSFSFIDLVSEAQGFSKDICRSMVAMLDVDHSGRLGMEEFKTLLNDIAKWKVTTIFKFVKCY